MPDISADNIKSGYYLSWNLNSNIDRELNENDVLEIEYTPVKNRFLTGLKPFLIKCKSI